MEEEKERKAELRLKILALNEEGIGAAKVAANEWLKTADKDDVQFWLGLTASELLEAVKKKEGDKKDQEVLEAFQRLIDQLLNLWTKSKLSKSGRDQKGFRDSIIKYRNLNVDKEGRLKCEISGFWGRTEDPQDGTGHYICAAHIAPHSVQHDLKVFGIPPSAINSPRNGFLMFKTLEETFDNCQWCFVYNKVHNQLIFCLLDRNIEGISINGGKKTIGDLDGKRIQLVQGQKPFLRLLIHHALVSHILCSRNGTLSSKRSIQEFEVYHSFSATEDDMTNNRVNWVKMLDFEALGKCKNAKKSIGSSVSSNLSVSGIPMNSNPRKRTLSDPIAVSSETLEEREKRLKLAYELHPPQDCSDCSPKRGTLKWISSQNIYKCMSCLQTQKVEGH